MVDLFLRKKWLETELFGKKPIILIKKCAHTEKKEHRKKEKKNVLTQKKKEHRKNDKEGKKIKGK